eukprot:TRINITY_DN635_c0_g3_i3.p1 TRINITY_DN635_c0_g3~~TRINITY_DN635_c0_g3_i3.p1  ORF type:complete len:382 (+),score=93.76 TRINITY_DN635_c0_g3_i3:255-1400(+)
MNPNVLNFVLWLVASSCWGSAFLFLYLAVQEIAPLTVTALRLFFGSMLLLLTNLGWLFWSPEFRKDWRDYFHFKVILQVFMLGILNNFTPVMLVSFGEEYINIAVVSGIVASTPLFVAIIAHFMLPDEPFTRYHLLSFTVGIFGLCCVGLQGVETGKTNENGTDLWKSVGGVCAATGTALSYAFSAVFAKKYIRLKPLIIAFTQTSSGAVVAITIALLAQYYQPAFLSHLQPKTTGISLWDASEKAWFGVLAQSFGSVWIGFMIYFFLLQRIGATRLMAAWMTFPVFGLVEGAIFLRTTQYQGVDEWLIGLEVVGCLLIIDSLIILFRFQLSKEPSGLKKNISLHSIDYTSSSDTRPLLSEETGKDEEENATIVVDVKTHK